MSAPRGGNVGTLLPDGDVLVTGRAQTFAELYHLATGTWSNASTGLAVCLSNQECRPFGVLLHGPPRAPVPELLRLLRDIVIPPPRRDRAHRLHWSAW